MKRWPSLLIVALISVLSISLVPVAAYAVNVIPPICDGVNDIDKSQVCTDNLSAQNSSNPIFGPSGVMTTAVSLVSIVIGIVAVIIIIIAGIKFMTSQGDPQKINTARNQIIYALVGIAVAALAQGLVALVLKKLP